MKVIVSDIDGTIANNLHRVHWVRTKPKNWPAFNSTILNDTPYEDIIDLILHLAERGFPLVMASGRTDDLREKTEFWIKEKTRLAPYFEPKRMYMRKDKDYRDDGIIKVELLQQIRADGFEPWIWLDDRQRVVEALRKEGIRVLAVQAGDF